MTEKISHISDPLLIQNPRVKTLGRGIQLMPPPLFPPWTVVVIGNRKLALIRTTGEGQGGGRRQQATTQGVAPLNSGRIYPAILLVKNRREIQIDDFIHDFFVHLHEGYLQSDKVRL